LRKPVLIAGAVALTAAAALGSKIAIASASAAFEAEASTNALAGGARIDPCSGCSGSQKVGWVGMSGTLTVRGLQAAKAGSAQVVISYASAAPRSAQLSVNGGSPIAVSFTPTSGWNTPKKQTVTLTLAAGDNTIKFGNPTGWAPDFDTVQVLDPPPNNPSPAPSPSATPVPPPPAPGDYQMTPTEAEVVGLVNIERAKAGCPAVNTDNPDPNPNAEFRYPYLRLAKAARLHSEDMAARNYFDHTTPDQPPVQFSTRITAQQYTWRAAGENIAKGQRDPAEVMSSWMSSPGHRANILNCGYKHLGVGLAVDSDGSKLWTQDFATPAS
jgi:uncharacterized protein YkwD